MSLLSKDNESELSDKLQLLQTLLHITDKLNQRVFKLTDLLYNDFRDKLVSDTSEVQLIVPTADLERTSSSDVLRQLQSRQLTLPDFCTKFLLTVFKFFFASLDSHLPWLGGAASSNHGDIQRIEFADLTGKSMRCVKSVCELLLNYFVLIKASLQAEVSNK